MYPPSIIDTLPIKNFSFSLVIIHFASSSGDVDSAGGIPSKQLSSKKRPCIGVRITPGKTALTLIGTVLVSNGTYKENINFVLDAMYKSMKSGNVEKIY